MVGTKEPPTSTRMFARVLGPFLVIVDLLAVVRSPDTQAVLSEFESNSLWSWVAGAFVVLFGLIVVAGPPTLARHGTDHHLGTGLARHAARPATARFPQGFRFGRPQRGRRAGVVDDALHRLYPGRAVPGLCGLGSGAEAVNTTIGQKRPGSRASRVIEQWTSA